MAKCTAKAQIIRNGLKNNQKRHLSNRPIKIVFQSFRRFGGEVVKVVQIKVLRVTSSI